MFDLSKAPDVRNSPAIQNMDKLFTSFVHWLGDATARQVGRAAEGLGNTFSDLGTAVGSFLPDRDSLPGFSGGVSSSLAADRTPAVAIAQERTPFDADHNSIVLASVPDVRVKAARGSGIGA